MEETYKARSGAKGRSFHAPRPPHLSCICVFINLEAPSLHIILPHMRFLFQFLNFLLLLLCVWNI